MVLRTQQQKTWLQEKPTFLHATAPTAKEVFSGLNCQAVVPVPCCLSFRSECNEQQCTNEQQFTNDGSLLMNSSVLLQNSSSSS